MSSSEGRTRREILADAAMAAAAASVAGLAGCFPSVGGKWPSSACSDPDAGANANAGTFPGVTPAVVEVQREESVTIGTTAVIQPDVVATMLDAGLVALANQVALFNAGAPAQGAGSDTAEAGAPGSGGGTDNPWKVLLPNYTDGLRIGLKINCLNPGVPTSPAIVNAIIASLRDKLGVDPKNIIVWDRTMAELTKAGYSADALAPTQLLATWTRAFDNKTETEASVTPAGLGYGDPICGAPRGILKGQPSNWPRLSRILTDKTDLTINCPVFKVHGQSGVTGAMKNIYGIIDNPGEYHPDSTDADHLNNSLPKLYALPAIRKSISLTIVDALIATTQKDTQYPQDAYPKRILLGLDPVALDSYALILLNQIRAAFTLGKFGPVDPKLTVWLDNAVNAGLGRRDFSLVSV